MVEGMKAAMMVMSPAIMPIMRYFIINTPFESAFSRLELKVHFQRDCFFIASRNCLTQIREAKKGGEREVREQVVQHVRHRLPT